MIFVLLVTIARFGCLGYCNAQQSEDRTINKPWRVGIVLEPMLLDRVISPPNENRFAPILPTALVLKHYFHPKNSFNIYLGRGAADGLSDYRHDKKDWFNGFNIAAGYEHAFFAPKRFNLLAGAKLSYTYSRDVLQEFNYTNLHFPNMPRFHTRIGPGIDLGMRYNVSKRFCLESNVSMTCQWPMPYNTSFKQWRRDPYFSTRRFFSLELYYHFRK